MSQHAEFDITVVGGGIVGGIFAALLAAEGRRIAIIEAKPATNDRHDPRVYAITRASEQIFRSAGIWPLLDLTTMGHFRHMYVWDANGNGQIAFDSQVLCEPTLGYIIDHQAIQYALEKILSNHAHVQWFRPATIETMSITPDRAEVRLESGSRINSRLIVGADGGQSRVRQHVGIDVKEHAYDQTAIVCSVKSDLPHEDTARQRFLTTGPLAFLPLADTHWSSIVWSTSPDEATELTQLDQADFHARLTAAFDNTLGAITDSSQRYSFPLSRAHAQRYTDARVALIGDAAHRIHPLAGQGANLGFLDAACLAQVLLDDPDKDPGHSALLRRYERWRKGNNLAVMASMDVFKQAFCSTNALVTTLRNIGLNTVNVLPCAKSLIMRQAMGLSGDLPALAQSRISR